MLLKLHNNPVLGYLHHLKVSCIAFFSEEIAGTIFNTEGSRE